MSGRAAAPAGDRRRQALESFVAYATLIGLTLLFMLPLIWVGGLSLKTRLQALASPPLLVWRPTLEHYFTVLGSADFLSAFMSSVLVSAGAVGLSLLIGVPAAYAFARFRFSGSSFLFFSLLVMRMLPPIAVLVPMYVIFNALGLVNTRFSVMLAYTTFSLPLVVWVMRGYFEELPLELDESAWIDGASRFQTFYYIMLPMARPGMASATILCSLLAWNDFLFAAVLTNQSTRTLPVLMASYSGGDAGIDWGPMTAAGVLVVLPVLLLGFAAQRHLVAGLSAGAVKG